MLSLHCPICEKLFEPGQSPAMPFCSDRCRWIDLKHWLEEEYGLAHEPDEAAAEEDEEEDAAEE